MVQIGAVVANYQVLRLLGQGGMGAVFEAVHQYIPRRVAIKVLHTDLSQNPQFVTRFLNEARAVNLVHHPGLVEIFEFGILPDGTAYYVMEYLEGESLFHRIGTPGRRWESEDIQLVRQIALALQEAHDKGIVHRDLKPENVMIVLDPTRPGRRRSKIVDFGIAKIAAEHMGPEGARYRTQTGIALGTPEYMAPEQCTAGGALDGKVDVYALGVILYEIVAGRLPFHSELAAEIMVKHVREAPRPLREVDPLVPAELEQLVGSMLAKAPADRPSMAQVADSLLQQLEAVKVSGGQLATLGAMEPDGESTEVGVKAATDEEPAVQSLEPWTDDDPERTEVSATAKPAPEELPATKLHPTLAAPATGELVQVSGGLSPLARIGVVLRSRVAGRVALALGGLGLLAVAATSLLLPRRPEGPPPGAAAARSTAAPPRTAAPAAPPPPRSCLVVSMPEGAEVLRASDRALLGQTPLRITQPPGGASLDVVVRRSRHAEQRVALSWEPDCRRQVALAALPRERPPGRRNDRSGKPTRPGSAHAPSVPIPVIH